ncbi:MAG TPA: hypothetical protein VGG72_00820 [Bryobacteraceae bacterium]
MTFRTAVYGPVRAVVRQGQPTLLPPADQRPFCGVGRAWTGGRPQFLRVVRRKQEGCRIFDLILGGPSPDAGGDSGNRLRSTLRYETKIPGLRRLISHSRIQLTG